MTKREAFNGKPYAGNPHVRFDEVEAASTTPRHGSLHTRDCTKRKEYLTLCRAAICRQVSMLIVWAFCLQALATEEAFILESAPGETNTVAESGTYTASQDLTFGALQVAASPVTFDFSETPSRKVVFDGASGTAFAVKQSDAEVVFKGGEWVGSGDSVDSFYCGYTASADNSRVLLDSCTWTNLSRLYVGNYASNCRLTLNNNSRFYASDCFLMRRSSASGAELNVLGGSGLYFLSTDTPFRTDNDPGNSFGRVTVAGEGSILSVPNSEFRFGYKTPDHLLVVSNKAALVANTLVLGKNAAAERIRVLVADRASVTAASINMCSINGNMTVSNNAEVSARKLDIGRDDISDAIGASVLITDGSMLTAKEITIRNPGCEMTVSNATLAVDSTANDAIKVGYEGRTGGSFVLSGESAVIDYSPAGNVEVFAQNSGNAEFRIENGASWNVTGNQIAAKTSNSVFRIASDGKFEVEDGKMQFGPAGDTNGDPATSLSNRLEVCEGGDLVIGGLRFSGHGNMLVVLNGYISSTDTIQIGYNRSGWADGLGSKDCALVMCGESGQIDAANVALQVLNGSVVKFVIPEDGYASGKVPLLLKNISFGETSKLEIDCEAFMAKGGGKVTLAKVGKDGFEGAEKAFTAFKETLPPGYDLTWENNTLVFRCPRNRFVFSIR